MGQGGQRLGSGQAQEREVGDCAVCGAGDGEVILVEDRVDVVLLHVRVHKLLDEVVAEQLLQGRLERLGLWPDSTDVVSHPADHERNRGHL